MIRMEYVKNDLLRMETPEGTLYIMPDGGFKFEQKRTKLLNLVDANFWEVH
jgi:hypothetical protein